MSQVEGMPDGEITGSRVKIGAEKHPMRNAMWIGGAVLGLGAVLAFYKMSGSDDGPKLKALDDFRAAYAQKCDSAEFRAPVDAYLRKEFLNSDQLQATVKKQTEALAAGASCADVDVALKAVSYPMAAKSKS
jgi:hypothetical protein